MNPTPLSTIAQWAGGRLLAGNPDALVSKVNTDSRSLDSGDCFVALRGEHFDAHDFIAAAAKAGAAGVIAERVPAGLPASFGVIEVPDTLRALQSLASNYRATLAVKIIGITGSNGKTSTKDFTHAVLAQRFRTSKTSGNLNNHIGVPLTLLDLDASHEAAVIELGMNHAGEIAPLAAMANPAAAIITNIGVAHIEFLGSREAIALEKAALAEAVNADGTVILNADDDKTPFIAKRCRARVMTAGIHSGDVRATDFTPFSSGTKFRLHATGQCVQAELPVPGEHMVQNALLASAAGLAFGLTLDECAAGLAGSHLSKGRLQQKRAGGLVILDDTYNANPDSVVAGLATLMQMPGAGRRFAVLGAMAELGDHAEAAHRRVGRAAAQHGIAGLIVIGEKARWIADEARSSGLQCVSHVPEPSDAASALRELARDGDIVLVKGSRSGRLERVVEAIEKGASS